MMKWYAVPFLWLRNLFKFKREKMTLNVVNDWLYINNQPVQTIESPVKKYSTGKNSCDFVIMHYTASTNARSAHNTFQNPDTQVSWHITVDRDGNVYQLYDFRKVCWHAGKSGWRIGGKVFDGMNKSSIGIELVNAGPLSYINGTYKTWSGQTVPNIDTFTDVNGNTWQKYTEAQLAAAGTIALFLAKEYDCADILGHEEISPGRKQDPGPAAGEFMRILKRRLREQQVSCRK